MRPAKLVRGHALLGEGSLDWMHDGRAVDRGRGECGRCECGALSPIVSSRAAAQRWHRAHKDAVIASGGYPQRVVDVEKVRALVEAEVRGVLVEAQARGDIVVGSERTASYETVEEIGERERAMAAELADAVMASVMAALR